MGNIHGKEKAKGQDKAKAQVAVVAVPRAAQVRQSEAIPPKVGATVIDTEGLSSESVYHFYKEQLLPALKASLPFLFLRIRQDTQLFLSWAFQRLLQSSLLAWLSEHHLALGWQGQRGDNFTLPGPQQFPDLVFQYCDADGDGHISRAESLNMTAVIQAHFSGLQHHQDPPSWWVWFYREWPLLEWKLALFVWKTCGGVLVLLTLLSIIPGRLHRFAALLLRWPVLLMTYFIIIVELCVYVIIRLTIRVGEYVIARPKHRRLRHQLAQARSYAEWYALAAELDRSQKRDQWLREIEDPVGSGYNWGFVLELLKDLRTAREKKDSILALAVLQQCIRKNVGGVMSEDMFSYSNTGEPKYVVTEFVKEVTATIRWVAEEAMKVEPVNKLPTHAEQDFDARLQTEMRNERDMLRKSLFCATLQFATGRVQEELSGGDSSSDDDDDDDDGVGVDSDSDGDGDQSADSGGKNYLNHLNQSSPKRKINLTKTTNGSGGQKCTPSQKSMPDPFTPSTQLNRAEVLAFLKRARLVYGRTALCLSGGAMMGLYHLGHLVGLLETGTLPHIVSGASAGSIIGAMLCTRTDEELRRDMKPEVLVHKVIGFRSAWSQRIKLLRTTGALFDANEWLTFIRWFTCGDMTFEEAYKKTGRIFCVTLSSTTKKASPVLLNYMTAPDVVIASACVASAAVPGLILPVRLQYKNPDGTIRGPIRESEETYFDGSIRQDIPVNGLAEMLNCQFFVVCQANPHIVPFMFGNKGRVGRPSRWSSGTQESSWRGGFLLAALEMYLKFDMKNKLVFLKEMEAAVGFASTLMTQEFKGSTTIVPQVSFLDYLRVIRDPTLEELYNYFQGGAVASYEHVAMIKLHYSIADVLDETITMLEGKGKKALESRRRSSVQIAHKSGSERRSGSSHGRPRILSFILGPNKNSGKWPVTRSARHEHPIETMDDLSEMDESTRDWLHDN